ncbi:hypothetical protein CEXT_184321 [Caerostris extrusa]|uniref:Uncharacterized protein n=1 Tax=Caerostris extrusa TaxID=172846 RepID=A0AAV4N4S4_CAEEX|nr:hypothetical protein CEXT_184321 [Caerostris extrusa]
MALLPLRHGINLKKIDASKESNNIKEEIQKVDPISLDCCFLHYLSKLWGTTSGPKIMIWNCVVCRLPNPSIDCNIDKNLTSNVS